MRFMIHSESGSINLRVLQSEVVTSGTLPLGIRDVSCRVYLSVLNCPSDSWYCIGGANNITSVVMRSYGFIPFCIGLLISCLMLPELETRAQDAESVDYSMNCVTENNVELLQSDRIVVSVKNSGILGNLGSSSKNEFFDMLDIDGNKTTLLSSATILFGGYIDSQWKSVIDDPFITGYISGRPTNRDELFSDCDSQEVFRLSQSDMVFYGSDRQSTNRIDNWPFRYGAPITERDGVLNDYSAKSGDVPSLYGEVQLWWTQYSSTSLSPEQPNIQTRNRMFRVAGSGMLTNTVFLEVTIENTGEDTIRDARLSFYTIPEIDNDFAGTDTLRALIYAYSANENPSGAPAVGITLLDDPIVANDAAPRLNSSYFPKNRQDNPISIRSEYKSLMHGLDLNGRPKYGGLEYFATRGCDGLVIDPIMFAGDPLLSDFRSFEYRGDNPCQVPIRQSDDQTVTWDIGSMMMTSELVDMPPGSTATWTFAISAAVGDDRLGSVRLLRDYVDTIKSNYQSLFTQSKSLPAVTKDYHLNVGRPYPNPVENIVSFDLEIPSSVRASLLVYNSQGGLVGSISERQYAVGSHVIELDTSEWSSGVYFARFILEGISETYSFVVVR